jgi:hypothetical protein
MTKRQRNSKQRQTITVTTSTGETRIDLRRVAAFSVAATRRPQPKIVGLSNVEIHMDSGSIFTAVLNDRDLKEIEKKWESTIPFFEDRRFG